MPTQPTDDTAAPQTGAADHEREQSAADSRAHSEAQLVRIFNTAPDGIYILRWPTVLFTNPAGARILEVPSPADAVGIDLSIRLTPDEATVAATRIDRKQAGERLPGPRQYHGKNPGGREFDLEITSIPIEFEGAAAVLSFARDVTERNNMLRKLARSETLTAMNTLAAGVSHEINNPLGYVLLNLEFLARELREFQADPARVEAMQRRVDDARQGAERVKAIVRDLQALTRKDENIRGPVELDQTLEQSISLARLETRSRGRVETSFEPVPCVFGNSTRLEQLFLNLLVNAAHALDETKHTQNVIRVSLVRMGNDQALIEINDNGSGMDEETRKRAFEPFFTTKPLGVGSGLGLSICKRIVDDLGGQISVDSQLGRGTTVRVVLRTQESMHRGPSEIPPAPNLPSGIEQRRGHVLIVDDERAVADSLRFALKDDHDVVTASSSKEARAALESGVDYDVVLCDLVMPVESGMDLHAYVSEQYPALAKRFVFMTGGAFTARAERFLRETPNPRIEKPFELETLRALIDGMVAAR